MRSSIKPETSLAFPGQYPYYLWVTAKILPLMSDHALRRKLAELALDSTRVIISEPARIALKARHVLFSQVLRVLQGGAVIGRAHLNAHDDWECTLAMIDAGDYIKVVAALDHLSGEEILVVKVT